MTFIRWIAFLVFSFLFLQGCFLSKAFESLQKIFQSSSSHSLNSETSGNKNFRGVYDKNTEDILQDLCSEFKKNNNFYMCDNGKVSFLIKGNFSGNDRDEVLLYTKKTSTLWVVAKKEGKWKKIAESIKIGEPQHVFLQPLKDERLSLVMHVVDENTGALMQGVIHQNLIDIVPVFVGDKQDFSAACEKEYNALVQTEIAEVRKDSDSLVITLHASGQKILYNQDGCSLTSTPLEEKNIQLRFAFDGWGFYPAKDAEQEFLRYDKLFW